MGRRMTRDELLPIMLDHLQPLVSSEKSYLSSHSKSGALEAGLAARAGAGDREGTISVFSNPSATAKQLEKTWGTRGRFQQRNWAAGLRGAGRRRIFYGPIVHQGHRVVRRNAQGDLYDTGAVTTPVPFAQQAVDALGDQQAEACALAICDHILG
jgi:hypothetical protein